MRDYRAAWQRLNVTAFLVSGLVGARLNPKPSGTRMRTPTALTYLPLLVQPLLVFEASADQLQRARARAASRGVALAIYTAEMFSTGNDAENTRRCAQSQHAEELDIVGLGLRAEHATPTPCCAASGAIPDRRRPRAQSLL